MMNHTTLSESLAPFPALSQTAMDPIRRRQTYGPIRPMEGSQSWWERLLGR